MVAPNYAESRRSLAQTIGLGRRKVAAEDVAPTEASPAPKRAPRKTKAAKGDTAPAEKPARKPRAKAAASAEEPAAS